MTSEAQDQQVTAPEEGEEPRQDTAAITSMLPCLSCNRNSKTWERLQTAGLWLQSVLANAFSCGWELGPVSVLLPQ